MRRNQGQGLKDMRAALKARPPCWCDSRGVWHRIKDMDSVHLWNTIKMLWNHTVPLEYRIGQVINHPSVTTWPIAFKKKAFTLLFREFYNRSEVLDPMWWAVARADAGIRG